MKVLLFSDGHIGEYAEGNVDPASGLNTRLQDTLRVWDWAFKLAKERKVDLVIFGGDRFQSQRPPAWMRDMADALLAQFGMAGIKIACLLGNHDLYDKQGQYHSWNGAQVWSNYPGIFIFDEPGQLVVEGITFHFMPYGHRELGYGLSTEHSNVLIFHDEVQGLSSYGPMVATKGLLPEMVDRPEFMAVFGGHVHLRQELDFKYTVGMHIGSALELMRDGDQGQKGALIAEFTDQVHGVSLEFVESPLPKILRHTVEWDEEPATVLEKLKGVAGNVVCLTVMHGGSATSRWRRAMKEALRAAGATSVQVDLRMEPVVLPEASQVTIPTQSALPDQLLEYVRQSHDESLIPYVREILGAA